MTVLKKGVRVTGSEREKVSSKVMSDYANGKSIRDIAAELGRSYGFVHRLLSESDQPLRSRGGATRRRRTPAR
ncbi:MAG TPA: helix-turn-helix domain-containing protein [Actinomycetales bacterium]|nr:helix-turn-helix domain-containing protein [Actinomycetales bacterium]